MAAELRVVFVGPSLWGTNYDSGGLVIRGPAAAGDIKNAVEDGAHAIGLIDGFFGFSAAAWHKEILFALSMGVTVYGGSSMGALRASEMHSFGMIPVGAIAAEYVSGELNDDAAVALISAPAELDYMPLSEPLVDALATIDTMSLTGALTVDEADKMTGVARRMHFVRRTAETIVLETSLEGRKLDELLSAYERCRVYRKRDDALLLIERMQRNDQPVRLPTFEFDASAFWPLLAGA